MQKITPCLWFDTEGEEAAQLYTSIFPSSRIVEVTRYGSAGPRDEGTVIFFGMATSFQAVALGAEGVAHPGTLLIGNGYVPGHAEYALDLLRSHDRLRAAFTELVG